MLRRNYRSTKQMAAASAPITKRMTESDLTTLESSVVYSGDEPALAAYKLEKHEAELISQFLFQALAKERLAPGCCLCSCALIEKLSTLLLVSTLGLGQSDEV